MLKSLFNKVSVRSSACSFIKKETLTQVFSCEILKLSLEIKLINSHNWIYSIADIMLFQYIYAIEVVFSFLFSSLIYIYIYIYIFTSAKISTE